MSTDDDPETTRRRPAPGRTRRRAMWAFLVPIVTAAAGLMFSMGFQTAQGSDLRADRDLPQLIIERNDAVEATARRLDRLQAEVAELSRDNAPFDERLSVLSAQADAVAASAAATEVHGPAITVSLDDSSLTLDQLPPDFTADDIVVHQQDVQAVVNSLWAAGAEAMMIQDQRIISTSAVRCVGNTLILQGRVYAPPYVIKAIGPVADMEASLDADPTVAIYRQYVDAVGLGYEVWTEPDAYLPAYSGAVDLDRASALRAP